jgi:hypothetical protein
VFLEAGQEVCEVVAGERPVEGFGDFVVVVLEVVEGAGELGGAGEVVGCQQLALDDRVVDLDLVQPARMNGEVDEDQRRPAALQPLDRCFAR